MTSRLNETHDPKLTSWVESANRPGSDFPIQNLPFALFRPKNTDEAFRGGVAIGDDVIDLKALSATDCLEGSAAEAAVAGAKSTLNPLMSMGPNSWSALRLALSRLLRSGAKTDDIANCLIAMDQVEFDIPAHIGDYTDFYTSIHHATNIGSLFRPDNPLLPNYKWIPIGYHGRSSSIGVSGQSFKRPNGQTKAPDADAPAVGPSKRMDYELEMGIFIGQGNALGDRVTMHDAEDHVFGLCLLNDWSARDIQAWEYQPLGPFLAKSFASTISPWIVTLEALAPYRTPWHRDPDDPQPLAYLDSEQNRSFGGFNIQLELKIETQQMRAENQDAQSVCTTNFDYSYWTVAQMVTHHTINGCNLNPGDLLGSGTMSGPSPGSEGALIEVTKGGKQPLQLNNGETRTFLEDGDRIIISGWCEDEGKPRIGFGHVESTLLPAD